MLFWQCKNISASGLKNISQIGSFPQVGVKIKNVWNHHPVVLTVSKIPKTTGIYHPHQPMGKNLRLFLLPIKQQPKLQLDQLCGVKTWGEKNLGEIMGPFFVCRGGKRRHFITSKLCPNKIGRNLAITKGLLNLAIFRGWFLSMVTLGACFWWTPINYQPSTGYIAGFLVEPSTVPF